MLQNNVALHALPAFRNHHNNNHTRSGSPANVAHQLKSSKDSPEWRCQVVSLPSFSCWLLIWHRMLEHVTPGSEDLAIVRYKLGTFYYVQVRCKIALCIDPMGVLIGTHFRKI